MVRIVNVELEKELKKFIHRENKNIVSVAMKIDKIDKDSYEIKLVALYDNDIDLFFSNNNDILHSFSCVDNTIIILFGSQENIFFQKYILGNYNLIQKKYIQKNNLLYPPISYEPNIWIYKYKNNTLELKNMGKLMW